MMQKRHYILLTTAMLAGLFLLTACGTKKNTWGTRAYHQMKVRYNIQHNGNLAYEEGLAAIVTANEDDYSTLLPLYPVSNHDAAQAATTQMDRTIEKCRKAIKLHSIKTKPKPDPKKRSDPKYRAWLQQEEFNNQLGNAWIRLGEAEFHKGEFLGAVSTFNYVRTHYDYDPDMVARCQLWTARAYGELGWYYEAEDMLAKVQADALSRKHAALYSAVSADVMLKTGHLHEAIPYIKIAAPNEKRKVNRPRFYYVLGQIYESEGRKQEAVDAYSRVIRLTPPVVMDFNARIRRAELQGLSSLKSLHRMTKQAKYKDRLDRIYGAIGTIYLAAGDTAKALENYQLAIENSKQAGSAKADVLIRAGDLYYELRDYAEAQPCYREAVTLLQNTHPDYLRLQRRSETLDLLIRETSVVALQDSLQRLSKLSEEEQRAVAERLVEQLIEEEKRAEEEALLAAREAEDDEPLSVNTSKMFGGGEQSTDWYFYNAQLMRNGKQEFTRRWGRRPLEDNWRRLSKSVSSTSLFDTPADEEDEELAQDSLSAEGDTLAVEKRPAPATDPHQPEYYLQQIPRTPEDIAASDSLIAEALNNLVYIYRDQVCDTTLADTTLAEIERRFPAERRLADIYYMYYLDALKADNSAAQDDYRGRIMQQFPDSRYAVIVAQPDYFDRLRRMAHEQDSLYENTYNAFTHNDFTTVKRSKQYAEQEYPLSPLMPRFLFLNAIAVARTEGQDAFVDELRDMVSRYPESELGAMAKDMLAMMGQGMESQKGGAGSSLADLRAATNDATANDTTTQARQFLTDRKASSMVLLILPEEDSETLNRLLYEVALFNFSQFLIRDFDLSPATLPNTGTMLCITAMESLDETAWYVSLMQQNEPLTTAFSQMQVRVVQITEDNYRLIQSAANRSPLSLEDYEAFIAQ